MAYERRALVGIGGWLAFFIVTLCLNAAGALLVGLASLSGMDAPVRPTGAAWTGYIVITMLPTPPLVIRLLWAVTITPPLAGATLLGLGATHAGITFGVGVARPFIYAAIWTAYLLRSERVANTYAGSAATDRLDAVFG